MLKKRILIPAVSIFTLVCLAWFALDYTRSQHPSEKRDSKSHLSDYCKSLQPDQSWTPANVPDKSWTVSPVKADSLLVYSIRKDSAHCLVQLNQTGDAIKSAEFYPD